MTTAPPVIEPRRRADFLDALTASAAGFVPELDLARDRTAAAMLAIMARQLEIVGDSLNGLPDRDRLAFADACANALLPASAARVPLVFELLDQAPRDLVLPAGNRVAARLPEPPPRLSGAAAAGTASEAVFATEEAVALSCGKLAAFYSIEPAADTYSDHLPGLATGATLFADAGPLPHELYLGHDEYFRLAGTAEITLSIDLRQQESRTAARSILLDWSYLSAEGWLPLDVTADTTARLTQDGLVTLRKSCGPDAQEGLIAGQKSFWIRAKVSDRRPLARVTGVSGTRLEVEEARDFLPGDEVTIDSQAFAHIVLTGADFVTLDVALEAAVAGARLRLADELPPLRPVGSDLSGVLPQFDVLRASVGFEKSGIKPDSAALDTAALPIEQRFLPFGAQPRTTNTFFLACKEAFQRKGASVRIRATLLQAGVPDPAKAFEVQAQYFNGTDWTDFPAFLQVKGTVAFFTSTDPAIPPELSFICPDNWAETEVNGVKGLWLKLRLAQGDFGTPEFTVDKPTPDTVVVHEVPGKLVPPVIDRLDIAYVYSTRPAFLDHCVAYNDFVFTDHGEDCRWPRRPFAPFLPVSDNAPAIHLGFTQPFPLGLVSLLVAGDVAEPGDRPSAAFVFEYRSDRGWTELPVRDTSNGFASLGLIQFIGPPDAIAADGLGGPLYRLRARLKTGLEAQATPLAGLWLNGVFASHANSATQTVLGSGDGSPMQTLAVRPQNLPVLPGELLEVREWQGRGDDWTTAAQGVPQADLRFEFDPVDRVTPRALWVRWHERPHFAASGPDDRHYLIDRSSGLVRFGDGRRGRIPPAGSTIAITHDYGGGPDGNVAAGLVKESRSSAAYLKAVYNPVPASGGAPVEVVTVLEGRAARRLRHRDRAVAGADYEWLAREASPELDRAAALPVTGPAGAVQPGWVALVLVPKSREPRPFPSQELRRRVQEHLRARAPIGIADRIRLVDPAYEDLTVMAEVTVRDAAEATAVEARLREGLDRFLHAQTGGFDGRGWPFGATLYLSSVARLVAGISGVGSLTRLGWRRGTSLALETVELESHVLPAPGDHQLKLLLGAG